MKKLEEDFDAAQDCFQEDINAVLSRYISDQRGNVTWEAVAPLCDIIYSTAACVFIDMMALAELFAEAAGQEIDRDVAFQTMREVYDQYNTDLMKKSDSYYRAAGLR